MNDQTQKKRTKSGRPPHWDGWGGGEEVKKIVTTEYLCLVQ